MRMYVLLAFILLTFPLYPQSNFRVLIGNKYHDVPTLTNLTEWLELTESQWMEIMHGKGMESTGFDEGCRWYSLGALEDGIISYTKCPYNQISIDWTVSKPGKTVLDGIIKELEKFKGNWSPRHNQMIYNVEYGGKYWLVGIKRESYGESLKIGNVTTYKPKN